MVTIGTIHGGTRNNIIPDEVRLELSVRSFTPAVRQRLLAAIDRIAKAEALAAGAPREPSVERGAGATALVNDPDLTRRVAAALVRDMGPDAVTDALPEMAAEDLAEFQLAGVPTLMLRVGAVEKGAYEAALRAGTSPTPLHSAQFAPDYELTIKSAVAAEVIALRTIMSGDSRSR